MAGHAVPALATERLLLRPWRDSDLAPFAALNADPEVMAHFPATLTASESDGLAQRIPTAMSERGFGGGAAEVPGRSAEHTSELLSLVRTSYAVFYLKKQLMTAKQST